MSTMVFYLSENEKLFIIILASCLFLLSVIITICIVSPICWFHKRLLKCDKKRSHMKLNIASNHQLITQESKHFQLSVVPHYGTNQKESKPKQNGATNCDQNATIDENNATNGDAIKYQKEAPLTAKIKLEACYEPISSNSIKLMINIIEVNDVAIREYGCEPSCYVCVKLFGQQYTPKIRRKSFSNKLLANAVYKTSTAKRCLNPVFNEKYTSPELPKSILKDGSLVILLYDDERYANDCCLGQISIPFKKLNLGVVTELKEFNFCDTKEFKGELLMGLCYLPTSNRVTISIVKATLNQTNFNFASNNLCYYVRILMFYNGKLAKKKKSTTSQKMIWGENEMLTFDLVSNDSEKTVFMLVLSSKLDNTSPSSPETPDTPDTHNDSRKDRYIGHFIIGKDVWTQMKQQPRKQIMKWHKLN